MTVMAWATILTILWGYLMNNETEFVEVAKGWVDCENFTLHLYEIGMMSKEDVEKIYGVKLDERQIEEEENTAL